ncbi:hypothetical protein FRC17_002361 [Serendipita sp. 399]|nr:hypothetical protein FRC17_002361 [Serendipita sp. 399]
MDGDDPVVSVIPIQLSSVLDPNLQLHQYPLSSRPLAVPPSARDAGKAITARIKPMAERIEVHVPFDTREEVWNQRRGFEYGDARREEDGKKPSSREEHRLEELRLRSEKVPHRGTYMIGLLRGGDGEEDEGGNDGGEDEEDDKPKRGKREAKEVHLLARKADGTVSSSMSDMRREMLKTLAAEEFEPWIPIKYADEDASAKLLEQLVTPTDAPLECASTMASLL